MKTSLPLFVVGLGFVAVGAGCTFPSRGTVYDRSRVGRAMNIETGDVVSINNVVVSGQSGPIGITGGGLVGHAAGSGVGSGGTGTAIAGAVGAVGGAIVGSATEEAATRTNAQEMTIKLSSGDTVVIVQEAKEAGPFTVGEHVQVLQGGAGAAVKHLY